MAPCWQCMRFGLLGPCGGEVGLLARAARFLLEDKGADQVLYLGPDDALDRVVLAWARELVGENPSDGGIWERAADRCAGASPEEIAAFCAAERKRERLKTLRCLPGADARTIELIEGRVAVVLYDKALLDEEDIMPAALLIFGKSREALVRQVGSRAFLTPGELGPKSGVGLLSPTPNGELTWDLFSAEGAHVDSQPIITFPKTGRFRVVDNGPLGEPS